MSEGISSLLYVAPGYIILSDEPTTGWGTTLKLAEESCPVTSIALTGKEVKQVFPAMHLSSDCTHRDKSSLPVLISIPMPFCT